MIIIDILESSTIQEYKNIMKECISLIYPNMKEQDIDIIIDYSINKRYRQESATLHNSYKDKKAQITLLQIADYIRDKQPITTAFGTMFARHGDLPNPMANVVQQFLDDRAKHKGEMFKYPKNSEMYAKFNLLQILDKIRSVLIILVV